MFVRDEKYLVTVFLSCIVSFLCGDLWMIFDICPLTAFYLMVLAPLPDRSLDLFLH